MMCQTPALEEIYLDINLIRDFVFNISCLPKLRYVGLQNNSIDYLPENTLNSFTQFSLGHPENGFRINLKNNPFHCNCKFLPTLHWMVANGGVYHGKKGTVDIVDLGSYTCRSGYPRENAGQRILDLPLEAFQCEPFIDDTHKMGAANVVLTILLALMCVLLLVVVYMNKSYVVKAVQPALRFITRKVSYSSLDTEAEVSEVHM